MSSIGEKAVSVDALKYVHDSINGEKVGYAVLTNGVIRLYSDEAKTKLISSIPLPVEGGGVSYDDEELRELVSEKMKRVVVRLVNENGAFSVKDYQTGTALTFDALKALISDVSNYVVCVYGNSKLRPQYVSTSEMMFIGLDRASEEAKVLRLLVTPTRVSYETFSLASKSEIDDVETALENIKSVTDKLEAFNDVSIINQPVDVYARIGYKIGLHVDAKNADSYQWQYSKDEVKWYNSTPVTATTDTILLTVSSANTQNTYRCKITGGAGSKTIYSEYCKIIIDETLPETQPSVDVPTSDVDLSNYYTKTQTESKFTVKTRIDFDGSDFKIDSKTLTYKELHDIHLANPDFAFVVYGDRAYLLSYVQDDASAMRELRFQSTISVTDSSGISMVKTSGIYVTSSDGVAISSVRTTDVNGENEAYKAESITDGNKNNVWYPSNKAVSDYVESKLSQINSDLSDLRTEVMGASALIGEGV